MCSILFIECNTLGITRKKMTSVYLKALEKFNKIKENALIGQVPMYMSKFWNQGERERAKNKKRENWYKRGDCETILFVDANPNGSLSDSCQKNSQESRIELRESGRTQWVFD